MKEIKEKILLCVCENCCHSISFGSESVKAKSFRSNRIRIHNTVKKTAKPSYTRQRIGPSICNITFSYSLVFIQLTADDFLDLYVH